MIEIPLSPHSCHFPILVELDKFINSIFIWDGPGRGFAYNVIKVKFISMCMVLFKKKLASFFFLLQLRSFHPRPFSRLGTRDFF